MIVNICNGLKLPGTLGLKVTAVQHTIFFSGKMSFATTYSVDFSSQSTFVRVAYTYTLQQQSLHNPSFTLFLLKVIEKGQI